MELLKKLMRKVLNKGSLIFKFVYFKFFEASVACNICGWKDSCFLSTEWHSKSTCPNCNSRVRQRLFVAILQNSKTFNFETIIKNKKILHFAPDKGLVKIMKPYAKEYKTADLLAEGYRYSNIDFNMDMANMKDIKDNEYDCVIAFDVLEHIPNHLEAIKEVNRVLKKEGYCIFTVPQKDRLEKTFEDLTITDPKERERLFGQRDHWRIYGSDFKQMIADKGFDVHVLDEKAIDENIVKKNVLFPPVLSEHPLATNYRKVYFGIKK